MLDFKASTNQPKCRLAHVALLLIFLVTPLKAICLQTTFSNTLPRSANAAPVIVGSKHYESLDLARHLSYLDFPSDESGQLTRSDNALSFDSVSRLPSAYFHELKNRYIPTTGYTGVWYRFSVINDTHTEIQPYLDLGNFMIKKAQLFQIETEKVTEFQTGYVIPNGIRSTYLSPGFNLKLPAGSTSVFYLHLQSDFMSSFSPKLLSLDEAHTLFHQKSMLSHILEGLLIGGIIYLLLISRILKERQENTFFILYLVLTVLMLGIKLPGNHIYAIFPGELYGYAVLFLACFGTTTFILFFRRFFNTSKHCSTANVVLLGFSAFYPAVFVYGLISGVTAAYDVFHGVSGFFLLTLTWFAGANWVRRLPFSGYYLLSVGVYMVLFVAETLANYFIIPETCLTVFKTGICNVSLVIVFSMSLASRVIDTISQQTQTSAEAEAAIAKNQAKSQFLAKMSHEIRTPMNGVLGMIDLLKETPLNKSQHAYIDVIEQSGNTLMKVINDILDYSKIEAGKLDLDLTRVNLIAMMQNLTLFFATKASEKHLDFTWSISETTPTAVIADETRITQVLVNLIANAFKFTEAGSIEIRIEHLYQTRDQKHWMRFSVTDTGIGIEQSQINTLFTAFEQADSSTTRLYGGTGLGLTICKQLAELMGGEIGVSSKRGTGTSIWFDLCLHATDIIEQTDDALLSSHGSTEQSQQDLTPLSKHSPHVNNTPHNEESSQSEVKTWSARILVAEDNFVNQQVIIGILKKLGHTPECVENGLQLVEQIKKAHDHYDLVLVDCEMPVMDGYEATLKIRQFEHSQGLTSLPILATTAHALQEFKSKSLEYGMNDHLSKPIQRQLLQQKIQRWLSTPPPPDSNHNGAPNNNG